MSHLQLNWKLKNNSENSNSQQNMKDKYKLREASIKKRIEVEHRKKEPKKRGPKPRPKSQPMSKYRRKTANLRERQRMGEINQGFVSFFNDLCQLSRDLKTKESLSHIEKKLK